MTRNLMVRQCLKKIQRRVLGWYNYYVVFKKAAWFISGLVICHGYVEYAVVGVFITFLKEKWMLSLPKAAAITNLQDGLSAGLKIVVAFVADAYLGRFKMVVYSTGIYILGLVLLCIRVWVPTGLSLVALLLISIGKAGRSAPLKAFLGDQLGSYELTPKLAEEQKESRQSVWWNFSWFLGAMIALFSSAPWNTLCLISATAMGAAWFCFLSGFTFYNCLKTIDNSLSVVWRVVKVAMLKRHLSYPLSSSQFYKNDGDDQIRLSPAIPFFRWLDKAAVVELGPQCPEEQQEKEGKLCTVEEVREVKLLLTMVPMWTTFLVYSLVDSLGNTFFLEQVDYMNGHIGIIRKVPAEFFLMIKSFVSFLVSYFYRRNNRHVRMMIGLGMTWSTLSCFAAGIVEFARNDETTVLGLIPQFIFLGLMEGFAINGLNEFFVAHVSESIRIYGPEFSDSVLGIGKFIIIILILVCKEWFGDDLSSSHLERFYGLITILSILNLIAFGFIATMYGNIQEMVEYELEEVVVDRSYLLSSHWRTRYRYWSTCSPDESETSILHPRKNAPRRLITLTGCGTELNHHIMTKVEGENERQLRTRHPEGWFQHCKKLFRRSFTAIGCETNHSQDIMTRRKYRFPPDSSLEASILMSKGWGPGASYSMLSYPGKEE